MSKKILITGVNGFVGKHLALELNHRGCDVVGVSREPIIHSAIENIVYSYYACDLTDKVTVGKLPLSDIDAVINLAGLANVGASFNNADLYNRVNVAVLSVIGTRLLAIKSRARMVAISTGAVYSSDQPLPLAEDSLLINTGSPYALSKIAMEHEAGRLRDQGLNCVIARPFNHIGPGQEKGFLVPDLYQQITEAAQTGNELKVGDLTTRRDYTDVHDVVKAYAELALTNQLDHDIYNVCSGRSVSGQQILDILLATTGQTGKITVEQDPDLIRPNDPKDLYGSNQRLHTQTGWQPTIPLEQTIQDVVASFKA